MKVVVLGASDNPDRYSYKAIRSLKKHGHQVIPVGIKNKEVLGIEIITSKSPLSDVDTLTLYIGLQNQPEWYDFILKSKPKRIIFNPGTENTELIELAKSQSIETVQDCTLVMLSVGYF